MFIYECMLFAETISAFGDMDKFRCAGDGVVMGEPLFDICSPSERPPALLLERAARTAAVATAASSTVPVW